MPFWCKGKRDYCTDNAGEACNACEYENGSGGFELEDDDVDSIIIRQWISVKDRLPEEETEVLCYLGNALGKGIVVAFRRHGDWYFDGWKCPTVTHWMPLPEPPKEDAQDENAV